MTLKDAITYDVSNVMTSTADFAEAATYTDSVITPDSVSLNVVWSDEGWADEDGGTYADRATVFVDYVAMDNSGTPVTPIRLGTVTRGSDSSAWTVREVGFSDSAYVLYIQKTTRPAPEKP